MAILLAVAGCAMAPKSSEVALDSAESSPARIVEDTLPAAGSDGSMRTVASPVDTPTTPLAADGAVAPADRSSTPVASQPAREQTELLALAQSLRTLSPSEQDQLIQDLKQTDPQLWPLVTQQFKASLEYQQRKQAGGLVAKTAAAVTPSAAPKQVHTTGTMLAAAPGAPPANLPPAVPPEPMRAVVATPASQSVAPVAAVVPAPAMAGASQATSAVSDWRQPLSATIASVEQSLRESPGNDDRQIYLRLLHLIAGHRDQALELVAGREPAEQEFWSKELYALSMLWDAARQPDQGKRRTEAAIHFDEANGRLRELGLLTIRNLAFCTEVSSYGVYKRFEKEEFQPEQRVLLYAELENFVSQPTPQGFHTSLKASYQIFDSRGTKVEDQDLPPMEESCQNPRRDFFVAYSDVRLPKQIYDGRYTLKLTIEDALGKKIAQSSIEFMVKHQAAELATR